MRRGEAAAGREAAAKRGAAAKLEAAAGPDWSLEALLWDRGLRLVAGVDEAGRGALCGPVVAAAVILPAGASLPYRDSKTLGAARRADLAARLRGEAVAHAVGFASAREVDELNVLAATVLAARRAIAALEPAADGVVTDYLRLGLDLPELAVAAGDARSCQVAAASILAKTVRDAHMVELAAAYPGYGFERHKGYGTAAHVAAIARLGPCPEHRVTFARVMSPTATTPAAPDP